MNLELTEHQVSEYILCKKYPKYFIEKYVKTIGIEGVTNIEMNKATLRMLARLHKNNRNIIRKSRQVGCTTINMAYILWYATFNIQKTIMIGSNTQSGANGLLSIIKNMHKMLPEFLTQPTIEYNMSSIKFSNQSKIETFGSDSVLHATRGITINYMYIDNFSYIRDKVITQFVQCNLPMHLSILGSKVVFVVDNHNRDSIREIVNRFVIIGKWSECKIPYTFIHGRDAAWEKYWKSIFGEKEFIKLFVVK